MQVIPCSFPVALQLHNLNKTEQQIIVQLLRSTKYFQLNVPGALAAEMFKLVVVMLSLEHVVYVSVAGHAPYLLISGRIPERRTHVFIHLTFKVICLHPNCCFENQNSCCVLQDNWRRFVVLQSQIRNIDTSLKSVHSLKLQVVAS